MPTLNTYRIQYNVNGIVTIRETKALSFLAATINASTNINNRPSLKGANITKIEEINSDKS